MTCCRSFHWDVTICRQIRQWHWPNVRRSGPQWQRQRDGRHRPATVCTTTAKTSHAPASRYMHISDTYTSQTRHHDRLLRISLSTPGNIRQENLHYALCQWVTTYSVFFNTVLCCCSTASESRVFRAGCVSHAYSVRVKAGLMTALVHHWLLPSDDRQWLNLWQRKNYSTVG